MSDCIIDVLLFAGSDGRSTEVSDCGRYVILYIHRGAEPKNLLFFSDLNNEQNKSISGE